MATKARISCGRPIDSKALVCQYCHTWQVDTSHAATPSQEGDEAAASPAASAEATAPASAPPGTAETTTPDAPPPATAGAGPAAAPARRGVSNQQLLLIIGGVALLGCVGCGVLFGIGIAGGLFYTQSVAATGDAFMTALRDSNYTQAYNLCTPELQRELRSAQDLERSARSNNVRPTSWNFTSRNIEGDEGRLEGTAQLEDGREATVRLALDRVGDDWKVSGFQIRPS